MDKNCLDTTLKATLAQILEQSTYHFTHETPLLGSYPELDSVGLVTLLVELESHFSINLNDVDLTAETFSTYGALHTELTKLLGESQTSLAGR